MTTENTLSSPPPEYGAGPESVTLGNEKCHVFRPSWRQLVQETVQVKLTVKSWKARARLTMADLGLDAAPTEWQEFSRQYLEQGRKRLMPDAVLKELKAVEERARQLLGEYGFKSPWGGYLIPKKHYLLWREHEEQLQQRHNELRDQICDTYSEWVPQVLEAYREQARLQIRNRAALGAGEVVSRADIPEEQIDAYVEALGNAIPTADKIRAKFAFYWVPSVVQRPEVLATGADLEELTEKRNAAEKALTALEAQIADANAEAERERLRLELEHLDEKLRIERELQAEIIAKAAEAKKQEVEDVLTGVSVQIRELLAQVADQVKAAIEKKGGSTVHDRSIESLRHVVERVRALNFAGDPEVDRLVRKVHELSDIPKEHRADADFGRVLGDISTVVRADLAALGRHARTDLGEVDRPVALDAGELRRARTSLGLDAEAAPVEALTERRQRRAL